jgi:hypothetical protein
MDTAHIVPKSVKVYGGFQLRERVAKCVGQPTQVVLMVTGWSIRRNADRGGPDREFRTLLVPPRRPGKKRPGGFAAESPKASVNSEGTKIH